MGQSSSSRGRRELPDDIDEETGECDLQEVLAKIKNVEGEQQLPAIQLKPLQWTEVRLFLSSTFIDTQAERDLLLKKIIPELNRELKDSHIRIIPIDLRWGVLKSESKDCYTIQKTCLSEIDQCRRSVKEHPLFIGVRTDRYGWIQDVLRKANEYTHPALYKWVDLLQRYKKELSITSLECLHAAYPVDLRTAAPTSLFYERNIANPEDIEAEMRWIFSFEHLLENEPVDENVKNQYNITNKARQYKEDKDNLNVYLRTLGNSVYRDYGCTYTKGGARITKETEWKKYGIGRVANLQRFGEMVRCDLLNAIHKNFIFADITEVSEIERANFPHEDAAKEKASTFVGRSELEKHIYHHCTADTVKNSVMVVYGNYGVGKSALIADVAVRCLESLRPKIRRKFRRAKGGDFVFLHIVDCFPGSNSLEKLLSRLHQNISAHTGMGINLQSIADLKSSHLAQLKEVAKKNPKMKFIVIIDAVNQLYQSMQSHTMWWLPTGDSPNNLRFIVSTIWEENKAHGTYINAMKRCPGAVTVEVSEMSREDCEEMVSTILKKYNKKLSIDDSDSVLGNQLKTLVEKSKSPLYLSAATELLRTQGVYEELSDYIYNLPTTVPKLFEFLLSSWEDEYGKEFIRYLMMIITLSSTGFIEEMIADILTYIEEKKYMNFEHSFSTVYSSIRGFFSCGGGGYLRFFHEQLDKVVLGKYGDVTSMAEMHNFLVQFFLLHIHPQLLGQTMTKSSYYEDCLNQVVHHQTSLLKLQTTSMKNETPQEEMYKHTLKNILFVKERITLSQEKELLGEYRHAIENQECRSLSEWEKFIEFYWKLIKDFPEWAVSFALSQPYVSAVAMETLSLPHPDVRASLPMEWLNKPTDVVEGGKTLRCVGELCWSCDTSDGENNLSAFGCGDSKALLCNQTTGDIIHQMNIAGSATSVHLSPSCEKLWVGNNYGEVSVWDVLTGEQEHEDLEVGEGWVLMITHIDETLVACGVGDKYECDTVGTITLINATTHTIANSWSTELKCMSYCYHTGQGVIVSGHEGNVICWDAVSGRQVNEFEVSEYAKPIQDMCAHPHLPLIVLVMNTWFAGEVLTLNISTGEHKIIIPETGRYIAKFDHSGVNIITTDVNDKTIKFYNMDGVALRTIRIHAGEVRNISPLPHPYSFISAGDDAGKIFTSTSENIVEGPSNVVTWCQLLTNKTDFVTLSDDGEVGVWDVSSLTLRGKIVVKHGMAGCVAAVHPRGDIIIVCTWMLIYVVDLWEVRTTNIMKAPDYDKVPTIRCAKFSPTGDKCIIVTSRHGSHVYHVDNSNTLTHHLTFTHMKNYMYSCDVRNKYAVNGGDEGVVVWDTDTGVTTQVLRTHHYCRYVQLLDHPPRVLYHMWERKAGGVEDQIRIMDMCGNDLVEFNTKVNNLFPKVLTFNRYLITAEADGSLRLHNLDTGKTLFVFADRHALAFNCFVRDPVSMIISCHNDNGSRYDFKLK